MASALTRTSIWSLLFGLVQTGSVNNWTGRIVSSHIPGLRSSANEDRSSPIPVDESPVITSSSTTDEQQLFTSSRSLAENTNNHHLKLSTSNPSSAALNNWYGDFNDTDYPVSSSAAVQTTFTVGYSSSSLNRAPKTSNALVDNNLTSDKIAVHLPATATMNQVSNYTTAVTPVTEITQATAGNQTTAVTYRATQTTVASIINVVNVTTNRLTNETSSFDSANVTSSQFMESEVSDQTSNLTTPPLPISSKSYSSVTSSSTSLTSSMTTTVLSTVSKEDRLVPSVSIKTDSRTTPTSNYSETANDRTNANSILLTFSTTSSQSDSEDFVTTVTDTTTRVIANIGKYLTAMEVKVMSFFMGYL